MSSVICAFFALLFGFVSTTVATMYGVVGQYNAAAFCVCLAILSGFTAGLVMCFEQQIDAACAGGWRGTSTIAAKSRDVISVTVLRRDPEPREFSRSGLLNV